jgi:hypothetical protein
MNGDPKSKRLQFHLRTLVALSFGIGLVMLLNLGSTLKYEIVEGSGISKTPILYKTRFYWYGWPLPACSATSLETDLAAYEERYREDQLELTREFGNDAITIPKINMPAVRTTLEWDYGSLWIDVATASLILYLILRASYSLPRKSADGPGRASPR